MREFLFERLHESSTSCAWPGTFTLRHSRRTMPFSSSTKVLRSMPLTCLPYMFFILMTANSGAGFFFRVARQIERQFLLGLEILMRFQAVARYADDGAAGLFKLGVEVADCCASVVQPGVSPWVEYSTTFLRRTVQD